MSSNYHPFLVILGYLFGNKNIDIIDNFHNIPNLRKNPPLLCI